MMEITSTELNDLAEKLESLDLTHTQHAVLDALVEHAGSAGGDDVSGFAANRLTDGQGTFRLVGSTTRVEVTPAAKKIVRGLDMALDEDVLQTF